MHTLIATTTLLLAATTTLASPRDTTATAAANGIDALLPAPSSLITRQGTFRLDASARLETNVDGPTIDLIRATIAALSPHNDDANSGNDSTSATQNERRVLLICTGGNDEAARAPYTTALQSYSLTVVPDTITIAAATPIGLFYGTQTLRQLYHDGAVPCCEITDTPRLAYRGLMLDCSRHFLPVAFILRHIDAMARYKLNRLHLHLTDAGGWRFASDRYPLLTELTAYRTAADWHTWWEDGDRRYCRESDEGAYGGAYTKDDLRTIVAYAGARGIVVVPEIEMPGHSEEVLHAYPALRCDCPDSGGDLCIGSETTFAFIEDILDEVLDVFPSPVIHIGGDEAGGNTWQQCSRCRMRMEQEGLADNAALQGYLTARVERYLLSRGRRMAGWDEILAGKPSQQTIVTCWRGTTIGEQAARAGHDVVMAPLDCYYLDYYQDAPPSQPRAMGIYTPLETVHAYDPFATEGALTDRIIGVQGNLWTEYIDDTESAERMLWPRAMAIAETGWSTEKRSYADFRRRSLRAVAALSTDGYAPFRLVDEVGQRPETTATTPNKASDGHIAYITPYSKKYPAAGDTSLIDGKHGGWSYADGAWQGFADGRLCIVIDMGMEREIHRVAADFMQSAAAWVYAPETFEVALAGDNAENAGTNGGNGASDTTSFDVVKSENQARNDGNYFIRRHEWSGTATARYVRISAGVERDGAWLFTDEVVIE